MRKICESSKDGQIVILSWVDDYDDYTALNLIIRRHRHQLRRKRSSYNLIVQDHA